MIRDIVSIVLHYSMVVFMVGIWMLCGIFEKNPDKDSNDGV